MTLYRAVFTSLLVIQSLFCFSQGKARVTGKVIDAETNKPIPYVNIFFNNTTFGTASDSAGLYTISNVPIEYTELVVSAVGYSSVRTSLSLQADKALIVNFKMAPDRKMLSTVVIYGERNTEDRKWNKNYKRFQEIFLGSTPNSAKTEILNPFVLELENRGDGTLSARANQPLVVENKALGYRLHVTLEQFEGSKEGYRMQIQTRFDTLTSKDDREKMKWLKNRMTTYKGSYRHLFRSIVNGRYQEEGFRIYQRAMTADLKGNEIAFIASKRLALTSDIYVDTTRKSPNILRKGNYQIDYLNKFVSKSKQSLPDHPYPVSWIEVKDEFLNIATNGEPIQPANFFRMGYLDTYRVADMLPYDFDPVKSEAKIELSKEIELSAIRGTVLDSHNKPLEAVEVFINNGVTRTTTNRWGQFEIPDLSPGRYPLSFTSSGKKEDFFVVDLASEDKLITVHLRERENYFTPPARDEDWITTYTLFSQKFLQLDQFKVGRYEITNPGALSFKKDNKNIIVQSTAPIVVENYATGYQWKYFIESATLIDGRRGYKLAIDGLVKMDSLSHKGVVNKRWQANRFDEYAGSWNNFAESLIEGRTEEQGFSMYQLNKSPGKKRLKFKKIIGHDLVRLNPDSLLVIEKGRFFMKVPTGLEVHYEDKKGDQKFYKGYSKQIFRIASDSSHIPVSPNGVINPEDVRITGVKDKFLKRIPVDYKSPFDAVTDPDVKVLVKEANLKVVKNLFEKTYLQTDKPYYYAGDTIWLKGYMKYTNRDYRDSLSKVLYVELINPENKVISNRILKITESQCWGDIVLSSNLGKGDYYLRAYTSWMRNLNEYFVRPLPVLSRENFIASQMTDTASFISDNIKLRVSADKKSYHTRDNVTLSVNLLDSLGPIVSSLSVSVTDLSAVSDLKGVPTIQSLNTPNKADGSSMVRIRYPVEKGVTFQGKIREAEEDETYKLAAILGGNNGSMITKVKGPDFRLTFDFADTVSATIKCADEGDLSLNTDILERDSIQFFMPPAPLTYEIIKNDSYTKAPMYVDKNTRVLNEVVIHAKRISVAPVIRKTRAERTLGTANKVIEGRAIEEIKKSQDLLHTLSNYVPDFVWTVNAINQAQVTQTQMPQYTASGGSQISPNSTFLSPKSRLGGGHIYSIVLNDKAVALEDFWTIPVWKLSRIEVHKDKTAAREYLLYIYTDLLVPPIPLFDQYILRGYNTPLVFTAPEVKGKVPDYRPTIYWNPHIKTDENGNATISFRTSDVDGTYKVTIEGMTADGEIFRAVKLLTVMK